MDEGNVSGGGVMGGNGGFGRILATVRANRFVVVVGVHVTLKRGLKRGLARWGEGEGWNGGWGVGGGMERGLKVRRDETGVEGEEE